MARTALTVTDAYGTLDPALVEIVPDDGDLTNGHVWSIQENDVVWVYNNGAGTIDVTLKAAADKQGRTTDSVETVAVGSVVVFGPLKREAWEQAGGLGWLDVDTDTDPQIVVLRLAAAL